MAIHTDSRGFEAPPAGLDADLTDFGSSTPIADGTAWSGERYLRVQVSPAAAPGGVSYPAATLPIPSSGQVFDYRMTIYFRVKAHPSVTNTFVAGCFTNCQLEMNTTGQVRIKGPGALAASAYSTQVLPVDPTLWYRLELRHYGLAKTSAKSNSGRSRSYADVFRAVGGAYLFRVNSAAQAGVGVAPSGDQALGPCGASTGGFLPFHRGTMADGTASFLTLQLKGLTGIQVTYISGGDQFAPDAGGLYNIFVDETTMAQTGGGGGGAAHFPPGCYRGNTGGTYTYIELGTLAPFNEVFNSFTIDDGLIADTFFLGQNGAGAVSTRSFDYDATFIVGATGDDIPPQPPPPPGPPPDGCPIPQPEPVSGSACVVPFF